MHKFKVFLFICLAAGLMAGCGGPAPKAEAGAEAAPAAEKPAEEAVAEAPAETPEAPVEEAEPVEAAEEPAPVIKAVQITRITRVNGLKLEGLIVKESGSEVVLKTEVGTISLSRSRIKTIDSKDLPDGVAGPDSKKKMKD